jgi:hypothetical protein
MITTTPLIDFRRLPNKARKKVKLERKKIRQEYIKVSMRKLYLQNTLGFNVQYYVQLPIELTRMGQTSIIEDFGDLGALVYEERK